MMKLVHEFRAISHAKSGLKQSKIPTNPQLPEGTIKHKLMLICWSIKRVFMDPKNQLWNLRTTLITFTGLFMFLITTQHWFFSFLLFFPLLQGCRVHWHLVGWWVATNKLCDWRGKVKYSCPGPSMAFTSKLPSDFMQTSSILNGICSWIGMRFHANKPHPQWHLQLNWHEISCIQATSSVAFVDGWNASN